MLHYSKTVVDDTTEATLHRFEVLDSFRGIFALMVAALHGLVASNIYELQIVRNSSLFVDFFFVLSGFVISFSYLDRIRSRTAALGFVIRRFGRLWPLHFLMLAAVLSLTLMRAVAAKLGLYDWTFDNDVIEFARFTAESFALVHAFREETVYWLNFPSWSISAEFWAYVTFAILMLAPFRWFWTVVVAIACYLTVLDIITPGFGSFFSDGLFRAIAYFILGSLTYLAWKWLGGVRPRMPNVAEIAVVALIFVMVSSPNVQGVKFLIPAVFASAILLFSAQKGIVSRVLLTRPFQALGRYSYSIYMIHVFVYLSANIAVRLAEGILETQLHSPNPTNPEGPQRIDLGSSIVNDFFHLGILIIVIGLSTLTHRFVEVPGQRWAKSVASRIEGV